MKARYWIIMILFLTILFPVIVGVSVVPYRLHPLQYRRVNLKALGSFNFDQTNGTIDDVPAAFRQLDGQRVILQGFMWSPNAAPRVDRFQIVYNIQRGDHRLPLVQERVFASTPPGKTVPYVGDYMQFGGVFHVKVEKEDGVIVSVFKLDIDSANPKE